MKALRDIVRDLRARHLWEPAKSIAEKHHVNIAEVLGRKRHAPIAAARNELYALAYEAVQSFPLVADILDRDHTTVMQGRRVHLDRVAMAEAVEPPPLEQTQLTLWNYISPRVESSRPRGA
jgi:chromosomal replication initiation ATPase DnaA